MPKYKKKRPEVSLSENTGMVLVRPRYLFFSERKQLNNPTPDVVQIRGRSSKEIREVAIPYLQKRNMYFRKLVHAKTKAINRIQNKCNFYIRQNLKEAEKRLNIHKKEVNKKYREAVTEIRKKLDKDVDKKVSLVIKMHMLRGSRSMEAATMMPFAWQYAEKMGIRNFNYLGLIFLTAAIGPMSITDYVHYGYLYERGTRIMLSRLAKDGWLFRYREVTKVFYSPTPKATAAFRSFGFFAGKRLNEIMETDEYKKRKTDWTGKKRVKTTP